MNSRRHSATKDVQTRSSEDDSSSQSGNTYPDEAQVFVVVAGRSYPRGGGESGTEDDSSGAGLNEVANAAVSVGASGEADGASTAAGPISASAIAARGSEVLPHEHA